jgi:hypothetical protein
MRFRHHQLGQAFETFVQGFLAQPVEASCMPLDLHEGQWFKH